MNTPSVWSLSGGKTSSYAVYHYPADYNVFALVTVNDPLCKTADKGLIREVENKIGMEFTGTAEDDLTLRVVLDLEQIMGREITWVVGESFDNLIARKKMLPNRMMRFCTQEMKIRAIFDWWFRNIGVPCKMGIGYRFDEQERRDKFTTEFKYLSGRDCFEGSKRRNRWNTITWRDGWFPLIDDKVVEYRIKEFWKNDGRLIFPEDSNCIGCFWKQPQQLLRNSISNPSKFEWFCKQEELIGATFRKGESYREISKLTLDPDYLSGGGPGCQAGHCTD